MPQGLEQAGVQLVAQDASAFNSALASATASVDRFRAGLDQAGKGSEQSSQVMTGALRRVGEVAVNALAAASGAMAAFVASSISSAADYEQSMNVLQSTTGATNEQMQKVRETAKNLGADLSLPATSAASAGDAMTYLAQQGLSVDDAMSAAKGTLQLAAAGMVDEKEAAITTASALNQFHLAGSEATRVADLLAASVSASGSSVSQTGQAVQQAGSSFAAAGVPIQDFVTLINEMSKAGIKGSDAGTSLKTMLMRLQAPTAAAAAQMQQLGVHVYDSQGAMLPMKDIITQFSGSLKGLTQQQRDQAVVTIFGADAQRAANIILNGGVDAYTKMHAAVTRAGAAGTLAGAQMKGLNGALAGLQSQLETLALEALEPILPILSGLITKAAEFAGSFVGTIGPAISEVGGVIQSIFMPALVGLTGALTTYAIVQAVQATPAILESIPAILAQTSAFTANALAVAAAVGPFVAVAAAIGGVVYAYNNLNSKIADATTKLLDSRKWWTDSTKAMADFGSQSDDAKAKLQPYADTIQILRDRIHEETEALGKATLAGTIGDEERQRRMEIINQNTLALQAATQGYNDQKVAVDEYNTKLAEEDIRTEALSQKRTGEQLQIQLSQEEYKKLGKEMEDTYQKGATAIDAYITFAIDSAAKLSQAIQSGNAAAAQSAATSYAEQAAAARASIGQQLSDWTVAYAQMHGVSDQVLGQVLTQIENTFGTAGSVGAKTMLDLQGDIKSAMENGGTAVAGLGTKLNDDTNDAIALKQKMKDLEGKYTAEIIHNFDPTKQTVQQLLDELAAVPRRVDSEVHVRVYTENIETGHVSGGGISGYRAGGGPVSANDTYVVGEQGPELFVPDRKGSVLDSSTTASLAGGRNGVLRSFFDLGVSAAQAFAAGYAQGSGSITNVVRSVEDIVGDLPRVFAKSADAVTGTVKSMVDDIKDMLAGAAQEFDVTKGPPSPGGGAAGGSVNVGGNDWKSGGWGRAGGGPVNVGQSYLVGEHGPELFSPATSGTIVPPATPTQIMQQNASYSYTTSGNTYNYSPTYGGTPRAPMASFLTMKAFDL